MSTYAKSVNIAALLTTFNLQIEGVPDNLKCVQCRSVLTDACQMSCGCRICRTCIDVVRASGVQSCPGRSSECGESTLSTAVPDYSAAKSISRLTAKCLQSGCLHESSLADMEAHLRLCQRKTVDCPFRAFGCQKNELTAEGISDHLEQDSRRHTEILIETVANINGNMVTLMDGMRLKDEQIGEIRDEMKQVQIENKSMKYEIKSIKDENKLIKREKEVLSERVTYLAEILEAIELGPETKQADKRVINRDIESVTNDIDFMKSDWQSTQEVVGPGRVDASLDNWLINVDISRTHWNWQCAKTSCSFTGKEHSYTYQLASGNNVKTTKFRVELRILKATDDSRLKWPFYGTVSVIVADTSGHGGTITMTNRCRIERPVEDHFSRSCPFMFYYFGMEAAGLNLSRGVRVSCQIIPGAGE